MGKYECVSALERNIVVGMGKYELVSAGTVSILHWIILR